MERHRVADVPPSETSPAARTKRENPGNEVGKASWASSTPRRHFGCESDRLPILTVLDKVPGC